MPQHFLKKRPMKPSGPGALSLGMSLIASRTSHSAIGAPRPCKSSGSKLSSSQLKSLRLRGPPFMTLEKCSWISFSLAPSSVTHPCASLILWIWFFLLLALTRRWKNLVFASPSLRLEILSHFFLRDLYSTAKAMTLLLSLARSSSSSAERSLFSWAMSRRRITKSAANEVSF